MANRRRRRRRKPSILYNIILILAIALFCISGYQLIKIGKGYLDGRSEYDKIRDLAITDANTKGDDKGKDKKKDDSDDGFRVDFDKLLKVNPDTIGWIRFAPEPKIINYPIVQGTDNQQYLHKTFSKNENTLGAIFLNADNANDFNDVHSILYGHRMRDGSMFRHLQDYDSKSFWKKNPYFYIYTIDGRKLTYQIFSAEQVVDMSDTYITGFSGEEDFREWVARMKASSIYDTGVDLTQASNVVTLSTCTSASDEHRFVVRGVRVKEEQLQ